jgi:hypothetical protein
LTAREAGADTSAREFPMFRSVLVVFAGLVVFSLVVTTLQSAMVRLYPLPAGLDMTDVEAVERAIVGMPAGAFAVLLAGNAVGAMCGGAVTAALATQRKRTHAAVIGGLTTLAGLANFLQWPHPTWVVAVGLPLFMVMALAGGLLGQRLTRA